MFAQVSRNYKQNFKDKLKKKPFQRWCLRSFEVNNGDKGKISELFRWLQSSCVRCICITSYFHTYHGNNKKKEINVLLKIVSYSCHHDITQQYCNHEISRHQHVS